MPSEFPLLNEVVEKIYSSDDLDRVHGLLSKYDLQAILNNGISKFYATIDDNNSVSLFKTQSSFAALATSFLTSVNIRLQQITDPEEKILLQNLISDMGFQMVNEIIEKYPSDAASLLQAIDESLLHTCDINGYNIDDLRKAFPIHQFAQITFSATRNPGIKRIATEVYYLWNSKPEDLKMLSQTLRDKNVISHTKPFEALFKAPTTGLQVQFNAEMKDSVIVLFQELYDRKLIKVKGTRGYFVPLQLYGVDFQKKALIEDSPRKISYTINKNQVKRKRLLDSVNKWLSGFEPKS